MGKKRPNASGTFKEFLDSPPEVQSGRPNRTTLWRHALTPKDRALFDGWIEEYREIMDDVDAPTYAAFGRFLRGKLSYDCSPYSLRGYLRSSEPIT